METITATRSNGHYFAYNDYLYLKQNQMDGTAYYRCRHRLCTARAICRLHKEPHFVSPHNHSNEKQEIEKLQFKQILRQRAATEEKDFKEIYMEEKAKNENIARKIPFSSSLRMLMNRARMMEMPPTPHSLFDIHEAMQEAQHYERFGKEVGSEGEPFYGGYIQVDEDESVVFWWSPTVCNFIKNGNTKQVHLHAELTSSVVPSAGGPKHLFTVLIDLEDVMYPIIFALMDKKTVASYCAVLSQIADDIFTPCKIEVTSIMVDYEIPINEAVKRIFPKTNVCGSWIHFARAILKKGNQLGIVNSKMVSIPVAVEEGIRMVLTLPILPKEKFVEAVNKIQHLITIDDVQLTKAFSLFCNYLIENWKQHEIFVQHLRNGIEPFHIFLLQAIPVGNRPQLMWTFIKHLQKVEQIKASEISETNKMNNQSERARILAETIRRAETTLKTDTDLLNFLRTVSHMMWRPSEIFEADEEQYNKDNLEIKFKEEMVTDIGEEVVIEDENAEEQTINEFNLEEAKLETQHNSSINVPLNQRLCFFCRLEMATCASIPCGHLSICRNCQQDTLKQKTLRNCPVCGKICEMIVFIH